MKIRIKLKSDAIKSPEDMVGKYFKHTHNNISWIYTKIEGDQIYYQFTSHLRHVDLKDEIFHDNAKSEFEYFVKGAMILYKPEDYENKA
jgi:hypothetical protein